MVPGLNTATSVAQLWGTYTQLMMDSNSVIAMRVMGMNGAWHVPHSEKTDMLAEKVPAFTEAILSGTLMAMTGAGPDRVMQATLDPLSEKARDNCQRLSQRGPRLLGYLTARTDP